MRCLPGRGYLKTVGRPGCYSELREEYDSVGLPCRIECTICGSPPCPILNFIYYIFQIASLKLAIRLPENLEEPFQSVAVSAFR